MSIEIATAAWRLSLPATQKLVLLALADHADDGGVCWPSVTRLEQRTGLGRRTIFRALDELEEAGHISRKANLGRGSEYGVHPCQSATGASLTPVPERHSTRARAALNWCQSSTQLVSERHPESSGIVNEASVNRIPAAPARPPRQPSAEAPLQEDLVVALAGPDRTADVPALQVPRPPSSPSRRPIKNSVPAPRKPLHDDIIATYHEILASAPRVKVWNRDRARLLDDRIRERVSEGRPADTAAWWRSFFEEVAGSDFLMNRIPARPFHLTGIDWLLEEKHFMRIIERAYRNSPQGRRNEVRHAG